MRLDLVLPNEGEFMKEALNSGPHFEQMGWEGLWVTDHLLGSDDNKLHGARWTELIVCMAHLAAQTKQVRICSGILVLPYRNPVIAAKMISSIDFLSGGRVDLGVGVGWDRREYVACERGAIFEERGQFTDEVLEVLLTCWKGGSIEFHGKYFDFEGVVFEPQPAQGARVPIWIGTQGKAAGPMRRAAKYADYWHPTDVAGDGTRISPDEFAARGEQLDEMAGRKIPRSLRIRADGDPKAIVDLLHQYKEAGCIQAACSFARSASDFAGFEKAVESFYKEAQSLKA